MVNRELAKLQRVPRDVARWQQAQQQLLGGRHSVALASYRDLVRRFPGVDQLWFELGVAASAQLEFELASQAFDRTAELASKDVSTLVLLGQQYHRLRRLDKACACFERAVAADPGSLHARLSMAVWLERDRKLDAAWECVEACLAAHPRNPQALCIRALLLHRRGQNAEAETLLRELIRTGSQDANVNYSSRQLLGVVLDALGQYAEALRWLLEAKALLRQTANIAAMEQDYDRADHRRRELLAALTPEAVRRWRQEDRIEPRPYGLGLLGGHPRSGTTLLEQILGAHPDLLAFDESEAFVQEVWDQIAPMNAPQPLTLNGLNALSPARRAELKRRYYKSLLRDVEGEPRAKMLLDKNPSPTASLHLWLRLFPESKIIIALRDPRDVVISCFFQNLMLTPTNANFLSLERAARHYADLMDVWLRLKELGGFDWLETRYEDLVCGLETEGPRATAFLGLAWAPGQANHQEAARRKFLFAPTYNDVTKAVHSRSVGRWQHYAEALAPIQDRLAPYCKAFGY